MRLVRDFKGMVLTDNHHFQDQGPSPETQGMTDLGDKLSKTGQGEMLGEMAKTLRNVIVDLKERLPKDDITSYAWLPTHKMLADILTKEKKLPPELEDVFIRNDLDLGDTTINKVMAFGQEVRMINIKH